MYNKKTFLNFIRYFCIFEEDRDIIKKIAGYHQYYAVQMALENIVKVSKDRNTIIIAHRLSTIRNADRIIVLENGLIKEDGSHEDLLAKKGVYNRLWGVQTGILQH